MQTLRRGALALVLVAALTLSVFPATSTHAQDPLDPVRRKVQQWLLEELGKPYLILIRYTYVGARWESASLGCPVAGQEYAQGVYDGYRWTFLFDNFVRYEVHSDLSGDLVVLCSAINTAADVPLALYQAESFEILTPDSWLKFPSSDGTEVLFGPGTGVVCDQAGMRVTVVGASASMTPDAWLDRYLEERGLSGGERVPVGGYGRSATFELPCEDNVRAGRVTFFVQDGVAYRVEQWSPKAEFDGWDELFGKMLSSFQPSGEAAVTVSTPSATPAASAPTASPAQPDTSAPTAQPLPPTFTPAPTAVAAAEVATEPPPLPLATLFVGDVFVGTLDAIPGRSITAVPQFERRYLHFGPDGRTLAYINTSTQQLRVIDAAEGRSAKRVAGDVYAAFPPAWSPDGRLLAYTVDTGDRDEDGAALLAIYRVAASGGAAELVGGFAYRDDCESTSHDPADSVYYKEAGPAGRDNVLVWLPDGRFLFSTSCAGGLSVLNPETQRILTLGDDLLDGAPSPDGTRFAARTPEGLAILDFAEWQRANVPLETPPEQLAWSADSQAIYYSTLTLEDTFTLDEPTLAERAEAFFGVWPVESRVYALTLARLDVASGQSRVLWQGRGRGIGRIAPAPDGSGVAFSVIPSSLRLVEVFQNGGDAMAAREAWPDAALYWLPSGGNVAILLGYAAQPTFGTPTLFQSADAG